MIKESENLTPWQQEERERSRGGGYTRAEAERLSRKKVRLENSELFDLSTLIGCNISDIKAIVNKINETGGGQETVFKEICWFFKLKGNEKKRARDILGANVI